VATQRALSSVLGQSDTTGGAFGDNPTRNATYARRESASVEKQDRLMTRFQTFPDRVMEGARKQRVPRRPLTMPP
jgi:hypothetical protein